LKEIILRRKWDCAVCGQPLIIRNHLGEQYITCDCGKTDIILDREILANFKMEIRECRE
jgi:hypothetical protein